jgi:hypothetical protein
MEGQTAIVLPVPAADALVSGDDGMPAHVTALYPFLPAERITDEVLARLRDGCARLRALDVEFATTGRFGEVLYLEPRPAGAVQRLLEDLAAQWPETPPYEGRFERIVPHVTVDEGADLERRPPFSARLDEACLYEFSDGRWRLRAAFPFG